MLMQKGKSQGFEEYLLPENACGCLELKSSLNNFVPLTESVEVGYPRHPGATIIGSQLQGGDRTDGWQNLTTQP